MFCSESTQQMVGCLIENITFSLFFAETISDAYPMDNLQQAVVNAQGLTSNLPKIREDYYNLCYLQVRSVSEA